MENHAKIIGKSVSRITKRKGNLAHNEDKRIPSKAKYIQLSHFNFLHSWKIKYRAYTMEITWSDVLMNRLIYIHLEITNVWHFIQEPTMAIVLPGNTFKIQRFLDESQGSLELMLCKSLGRFGPEICRQGPEESSFEIRSTLNPRKIIKHLKDMKEI